MTKQEYAQARQRHGLSVKAWIELLGISQGAHDSYTSGRRVVPAYIEAHIKTLEEMLEIEAAIEKLAAAS